MLPHKIGQVSKQDVDWYLLKDGRLVSFHTAFKDKDRTQSVTLFSESDSYPSNTAQNLNISYSFMRNATKKEAKALIDKLSLKVKEIISV